MSETTLTHDPDSGCLHCPLLGIGDPSFEGERELFCRVGAWHEAAGDAVEGCCFDGAPAECPLRNGGRVVVEAGKGESDA